MTIGRPKQYDPDQAIELALDVFWQYGYSDTSMDDLLQTMQLSKSSFYQAFQSKKQLFLTCLDYYIEKTHREFSDRLKAPGSGRQFFVRMLKDVITDRDFGCRGCLITNCANEFAQSDEEISRKINHGFNVYRKLFLKAVEAGQRDGSIGNKYTARLMTDYLLTNVNGLRTLVKAGTPKKSLADTARIIVNSLN